MAVEFTQEVSRVAKTGQPVPRLVWFYFDGAGEVPGGCGAVRLTDAMADYSTRLKISVDKVWTTPS